MSDFYSNADNFISNDINFRKLIIFIVVFLCAVKLPGIIFSDIQPWDEGMYATRVLSIHLNGDFFDQSSHSVGRFYSGSHPPLLIWIGYFSTLIFGINSFALKIIPFIFSLLCVVLIMSAGKKIYDSKTAFYASLIFCSNIIFNVFSKRFQFDYPYTFFILFSIYTFIKFNESLNYRYLVLSAVSFGCCLMVKILVGFYIPMILVISWFFVKDKVNFRFKDIVFLVFIGILIALPWHIFMLAKYGSDFTDFFFKFHIYDRAVYGVEMNQKNSGVLYHINYLLTIIPFSVLIFFSMYIDLKSFRSLSTGKIILWIWFLTGLLILALFKTKLEVYVLLILTPGCLLMTSCISQIDKKNFILKRTLITALILNIFWYATESVRPEIKSFLYEENKLLILISTALVITLLYFLAAIIADKIELQKAIYIFIFGFFLILNLYYLIHVPFWENDFHISEVKNQIEKSGRNKIVYVATNYRHNPQFSFYFKGLDLGWENNEYELIFLDNKEGYENVKEKLKQLPAGGYEIIVEKEGINRAVYGNSDQFIPSEFRLAVSSPGYELYEN